MSPQRTHKVWMRSSESCTRERCWKWRTGQLHSRMGATGRAEFYLEATFKTSVKKYMTHRLMRPTNQKYFVPVWENIKIINVILHSLRRCMHACIHMWHVCVCVHLCARAHTNKSIYGHLKISVHFTLTAFSSLVFYFVIKHRWSGG